MNVRIEEVSPVEKKIAVEVEWPMVAARLDEAYRDLGRNVTIKGFRRGKAPRPVLERMYAHDVERDVAQKLLQETFLHAAQKHEIEPIAEPVIDEFELKRGTGLRYSARVEVRAPIDPQGYDGLQLERPTPTVTEEEVVHALEHKREELAEYRKIEERDRLGASDVVIADVQGEIGGKPFTRDAMMIDLGHGAHEPIPGIGAALVGAPTAAKDHPIEFVLTGEAGQQAGEAKPTARLKITVRDAREKMMPALDDDFAKDTGEADTLEELRVKARAKVAEQKDKEIDQELRRLLVKELLARNEFPVPPALVERQLDVSVQRARFGMAMRGVDPMGGAVDQSALRDELRAEAIEEVRAMFLLDAIATKEKVEVTESDIEKKLADLGRAREKSAARLKAELQKEERFETFKYQLREEKTLDLLLTRANIKTKV